VLRPLFTAYILWSLGYADVALQRLQAMLTLAQELAHPFSKAVAPGGAACIQQLRRDIRDTQARAEAALTLATEQGFPYWMAGGAILRGWALAAQGQAEEGICHMQQGLTAYGATGAKFCQPFWLALLAEAYGQVGRADEGLRALDEALAHVDKTGERFWEAELYRLQGELLVIQGTEKGSAGTADSELPMMAEAEMRFVRALDIARRQQARSWELRAATSLSRLWQHQGIAGGDGRTQAVADTHGPRCFHEPGRATGAVPLVRAGNFIGRQIVQCKGRVQGNVVVLEEGVHLPDGTPVTVMVEQRDMAEQEEITQEELAQRRALVGRMKAFGQRLVGRHVTLSDLILAGREELEDRA
jgi:tetratricopeptide (TPR) repeat protein